MKLRLNEWYGRFYDVLQRGAVGPLSLSLSATGSGELDADPVADPVAALDASKEAAMRELVSFALLVAPAVVLAPLCGLARHWWVFCWRQRIIHAYLSVSSDGLPPIEGASQRVHEDTERFASGVQSCCAVLVEAVLTLLVFLPVLTAIDPTLSVMAFSTAVGAVGASAFLGRRLVDLEVENQVQEAALRRHLVLAERPEPASFPQASELGFPTDQSALEDADGEHEEAARARCLHESQRAKAVLQRLRRCYWQLYTNFACLSTWLSALDQALAILPYVVITPRLFDADASQRLSLGDLTRAANAFSKVFESLNVLSDNYLAFNAWRSVLRRLLAYERRMRQFATSRLESVASDRTKRSLCDVADAEVAEIATRIEMANVVVV